MTLENQLREAYERAAERAPVSLDGYDRFLRRRARHGRVMAASAGLALVAVLGAAVLVTRQLPEEQEPTTPATTAAEPTPRPHQWVYSNELRVEYGGRKPYTIELWDRVDGKKYARPTSNRRTAGVPKVRKEQEQFLPFSQGARLANRNASAPPSALATGSPTPLPCPLTPTGCSPPSIGWSRTPPAPPFPLATPSRTGPSC
jgi:hypothetical protein